jgi:hypothetical protein
MTAVTAEIVDVSGHMVYAKWTPRPTDSNPPRGYLCDFIVYYFFTSHSPPAPQCENLFTPTHMEPSIETSPARKEPDKSESGAKVTGNLSSLNLTSWLYGSLITLWFQNVQHHWDCTVCGLHLGGPCFDSWSERRVYRKIMWFPSVPSENAGRVTQLGRDRFLPNPFQFVVLKSSYLLILCNLRY